MTRRYYKYEETHRTVKGVKQKRCPKCKKWKEEGEFHKDRTSKDGLVNRCKDCSTAYNRERYWKDKKHEKKHLRYEECHRVVGGIKQKLCCRCKIWKDEIQFCKSLRSKDGLQWRCRACDSKYVRERYKQTRKAGRKNLRYEERHRIVNGVKQKYCRKCSEWKAESEFYKSKASRDGLDNRCKKCSYKARKSRKK